MIRVTDSLGALEFRREAEQTSFRVLAQSSHPRDRNINLTKQTWILGAAQAAHLRYWRGHVHPEKRLVQPLQSQNGRWPRWPGAS
jgi:hypothetical protein